MSSFATVLRAIVSFGWLALIAGGGYLGYRTYHEHDLELEGRDQRIAEQAEQLASQAREVEALHGEVDAQRATIHDLEVDVAAKQEAIDHLELSLRLLKVDQRRAQLVVVDQRGSAERDDLVTRVKFLEVDDEGEPIGEVKNFDLDGDVLYVDAWVVKFDDALVEEGDPLRKSSLVMFRRMFGEDQQPSEGMEIDVANQRPEAYGGQGAMGEFEQKVWSNFWEYANDTEKAKELGIRAAHGEAVSMKLLPGRVYQLSLRASGGLTFEPAKLPAVMDH